VTLPYVGVVGWLDLVLVVLLGVTALAGWRRGLIHGVLSLCGFVIGGFFGVTFAPQILNAIGLDAAYRALGSVMVVLVFASLGNAAASRLALAVRAIMSFRPIRFFDNVGGAAFNLAAVSLVLWLVASALVANSGPFSRDINSSRILGSIDTAAPGPARYWMERLQAWIDTSGLPRVITGIGLIPAPPAAPPDPQIAQAEAIQIAARSVVRIEGEADGCAGRVVGSGFVFASNRVMTNAHVVAGVSAPFVAVPGGRVFPAEVVSFDPQADVAVLRVPGLNVRPLLFGSVVAEGESTVALGYPGGGDLTAEPATVRSIVRASGTNIYGRGPVEREVVTLRAAIVRGNSGGPLVNRDGEVVGLIFAQAIDDDELGFALALSEFLDDAERGATASSAVPVGRCTASD
jgi:S1-C subfamily serine protease